MKSPSSSTTTTTNISTTSSSSSTTSSKRCGARCMPRRVSRPVPEHHASWRARCFLERRSTTSSGDSARSFSREAPNQFSGLAGGGASAAAAAAAAAGQQALASSSEKPKQRHSSKYGFRFLKHERAILEKWYAEQDGRTAPITIRKEWVGVWNEHRKHLKEEHCEVSHQQVKQWFETMRRTTNHKGGKQPYSRSRSGGAGGAGGAYSSPGGGVAGEATMNPRLYLAASTGKMHTAI